MMPTKILHNLEILSSKITRIYLRIAAKFVLTCYLFPAITLFMSGILMNFIQAVLYVTVRPISKKWFRKINRYICASMYAQVIILPEWLCDTDIIIYVDPNEFERFYGKEHAFCLINHTYEIDWLINWLFCTKIGCLGNFKACSKTDAKWLPTFGWSWMLSDFVFLERSFEKDQPVIVAKMKELFEHPDPIWLTFYPEGTRYTTEKHEMSKKFSALNNLPTYKHHLLPRTKGFLACLPVMKEKNGGLYDVVMAFNSKDGPRTKPTIIDLINGEKIEAHIYLRRIPFEEVPQEKEQAVKFLYDIFERKDKLQDSFYETGDFFTSSGIEKMPGIKLRKGYTSLLNFLIWNIIFTTPIIFFSFKLLYTGRYMIFLAFVIIFFAALLATNKCMEYTSMRTASSYGMSSTKKN